MSFKCTPISCEVINLARRVSVTVEMMAGWCEMDRDWKCGGELWELPLVCQEALFSSLGTFFTRPIENDSILRMVILPIESLNQRKYTGLIMCD
jgi:hypothetical protein